MEVEIATSSPFGCAARRDSCFQNNHQIDLTDLWVHQPQWEAPTGAEANCNDSDYRPSIDYRPKDKWARAREIVFPGDRKQPPVEVSNSGGGVSSLVQKWRGFEAEAKVATKSSSCAEPTPPLPQPVVEDESSIGDWESDRTVVSGRSSCREQDSDFTERERLRVADIIKRLTAEEGGGSYSPPRVVRTSWDHQSEKSSLSPVMGSPRIRGRQAYIDILTQMERDRRNELERLLGRKAVSQFSHRGRIQALLRIKFLRRGLGAIEGRFSNNTASKPPPPPTHFRRSVIPPPPIEPENVVIDKGQELAAAAVAGNEMKEEEECHQDDSETSKEEGEANNNICIQQQNDEVLPRSYPHKASPFSKFIRQDSSNMDDHSLAKYAETENKQNKEEDQDIDHHLVAETNYDTASDFANTQSHHEEEDNQLEEAVESDAYWVSDASHPEGGWEEVQSEEGGVSKGDWIGEVSRPRSDWEDLRQARYQEMLDPFLNKEEIRALLGRKSVSSFLSSGMREKIDQVMMCRCQTVVKSNGEEKHEEPVAAEEAGRQGYGDYFDEFEEAESSLGGQQYTESEYMDQTPAWPQNQGGHESSVYSYQVESTPPQQSPSIGPNSSYGSHPVIEMEVIYDLRRHMEQLHQEMSELRKSIKCCTDMQVKLQRSIKKEVTTAADHTANGRRNPTKKTSASGGRCCVCRKVHVDCVLYRCGHMCTCFKCAHELQWSSGKCPVCRARIVDVVRTYSNY